MTLDPSVKIKGQENAYKEVIKTAVGGAAGVIHQVDSPTTDCQPNDNVEALRVWMLNKKVECRPVWKPMHKQPVYKDADMVTVGDKCVCEKVFERGLCLPSDIRMSPSDQDLIIEGIKECFN